MSAPIPQFGRAPSTEMARVMARLAEEDRGLPDIAHLPPAEGRAQAERVNARWNIDLPAIDVREVSAEAGLGMRARLAVPAGADGLVLHVHGGGWAICSIDTHERASRCLAVATGMAVLSIDYRLAPEHRFPAGLEDTRRALDALPGFARRSGLSGRLGIAGDSSGANLALAAMLANIEAGGVMPDFGLLFYGVYSADFETESQRYYGTGFGLTTERMKHYWSQYQPDPALRRDPLVAPLLATDAALQRLPPLYLNAAGLDPLLSDSLALAARLNLPGRTDALHVHEGVIHGFMQMTTVLAEARDAFQRAGDWVAGMRKMGGTT